MRLCGQDVAKVAQRRKVRGGIVGIRVGSDTVVYIIFTLAKLESVPTRPSVVPTPTQFPEVSARTVRIFPAPFSGHALNILDTTRNKRAERGHAVGAGTDRHCQLC